MVYYRKKRGNGRVVSVYVGSVEADERAERADRERREAVEALRRAASAFTQTAGVLPVAPARVEEAAVTQVEDEARWAEFFRPRAQPRRYRSRWPGAYARISEGA